MLELEVLVQIALLLRFLVNLGLDCRILPLSQTALR